MTTTINSTDAITSLASGKFRAHRQAVFWVGDYTSVATAKRALEIANSKGALPRQRGTYDGGPNVSERDHLASVRSMFGIKNRVSEDEVARTVLAGEIYKTVNGIPTRA